MELSLLARGLVIGFSIAAPVGPIGVLCIRRTLAEGRVFGLVTGLGAATADALYGCVAGFGLTLVSGLLVGHQAAVRVIGGAFLCYLGVRTVVTAPAPDTGTEGSRGLLGAYASTFLLTLANPMTILSFAAIFAGLGLAAGAGGYGSAAALVTGVFLGSAAWWLALSGGVSLLRARVTRGGLRWVNRVSGLILLGFGLLALLSLRA
jgi:threonine/homoserine/homoserine lactone efflux protein